jgi:hypothetical protein
MMRQAKGRTRRVRVHVAWQVQTVSKSTLGLTDFSEYRKVLSPYMKPVYALR